MTVLVDGALLRGVLVPSEVSAAFLDDALRRSAHAAVGDLENADETPPERGDRDAVTQTATFALQLARAFLQRVKRRPFGVLQARTRQRNANALMALNKWHETRDHHVHLTALDVPGSYAD